MNKQLINDLINIKVIKTLICLQSRIIECNDSKVINDAFKQEVKASFEKLSPSIKENILKNIDQSELTLVGLI